MPKQHNGFQHIHSGRQAKPSAPSAPAVTYRDYMTAVDLRQHKADYGYDGDYRAIPAPAVAGITAATSAALLASAARSLLRPKPVAAAVTGTSAAALITTAALFIRTTRIGKFEVWANDVHRVVAYWRARMDRELRNTFGDNGV